jgi:hypothetical protein
MVVLKYLSMINNPEAFYRFNMLIIVIVMNYKKAFFLNRLKTIQIFHKVKEDSAQINIDYLAGVSIFLLAVAFVFQFVNGLFIPFQSGSDGVTLAANSAGTILVERMLVANGSGTINVIDQGKLNNFINSQLNQSNYIAYHNTLLELGLFSNDTVLDVNVSVTNLTYPDNPMSQNGPELPQNVDIGQNKRLILIVNSSSGVNENAIISVRVW